ncbi:hypothetical protein [Chitinophaga sp. LS1]|uniref:tyrosine-type recombinase/integrase n=1 Tax=Chitinophaga sp. LS1 TaxID=3051176 RepID=UPI002AAAD26F|nr:hypothetical protein [Chitinophaga sp. LS1]WPV66267.1 hypothetical protein QQL36_31205 [Chitinophaga sp. LS1]
MNTLPSNCRYTDFNLHPANWNTTRASLKKKWRIEYWFHDPKYKDQYPKGYPKVIKAGLNRLKDLAARQQLMLILIENEKDLLENQGYNPITKTKVKVVIEEKGPDLVENNSIVDENTPFIKALELGLESKRMDPESKKDIKNKIPHVEKAAKSLKYKGQIVADMPISSISRKIIRLVLDEIGRNKGDKWTANNYNRYRTDLRTIFIELNELEAMESNPMDGIRKLKGIKRERETLTPKDRIRVNQHLKDKYYTFWRFSQVFFHSGCREVELLGLTFENVNISERWFKVLVKKGTNYRWDKKAIEPGVVKLWEEIMHEAETLYMKALPNIPKDKQPGKGKDIPTLYIFSEDLKPMFRGGPIRQEQISRRWYSHVKKQLGITADFYSLKHSRTSEDINSEVRKAIRKATKKAARKNGHTSSKMVEQVYDTQFKDRLFQIKKQAKAQFAGNI